jgi:hypothetical protein
MTDRKTARLVPRGDFISNTMTVIMTARTPSLKASRRQAYEEAGRQGAEDLKHAIEYGASVPQVDTAHTIAVRSLSSAETLSAPDGARAC